MKFTAIISLLAIILLGSTGSALAQEKNCSFDIVGTWKAQTSSTQAYLYRFDAKGGVTVLSVSGSGEPKEVATASYTVIDEPDTPKSISFTATGKNRIFGAVKNTMKVVSYDDSSVTCEIPGAGTTRWTRVDPDRYFIVLSARKGEFYDTSGTSFPAVIKVAGGVPTVDAVGIYAVKQVAAFGAIPPGLYKDYMREPRGDSEIMLRLEINSRQYERALKVINEWQRRAREGSVLYNASDDAGALNNILVVKAVTETLNQCSEDFDLYKLDYIYPGDWIADKTSPEFIPFVLFQELRRRNEARHISDQKFQELIALPSVANR